MLKIIEYFTIIAIIVTLFACKSEIEDLTEAEKKEITIQIKQLSSDLFDSWNKAEYYRYMNYYSRSDAFTFAANGNITRTWSAFSDTVKAHTNPLKKSEVKVLKQYIDIIERNIVIVTEFFDWSAIYKSDKVENMQGTYTTIYAKRNNEWKIIYVAESFPGEF
jgi:ketosteroid isomerase-like protein